MTAWGVPDASKLDRLAAITQPMFLANGDNDTMLAVHVDDRDARVTAGVNAGERLTDSAIRAFSRSLSMRSLPLTSALVLTVVATLGACAAGDPTGVPSPTAAAPTTAMRPDGPTVTPTAPRSPDGATVAPTAPRSPDGAPAPTPTGAAAPSDAEDRGRPTLPYLDDRSGPEQLLRSYVSALDRREYLRAYSYWRPGAAAAQLPPFPEFAQGFADTASVRLALGEITGDAGAGQLYYVVPVELVARAANGATRVFVGCYQLHLARPELQAEQPFEPLAIEGATVESVPAGGDGGALLGRACAQPGHRPPALGGTPDDPADVGAARYLDDRSTPEQILRSYHNAVNRKELARAHYYWETGPGTSAPPFDAFARGYAEAAPVQLRIGRVTPGAGAGNLYYAVPVVLVARGADGAPRTFAGCYTLHLAQPSVQAQPPFRPMGIRSAAIHQTGSAAEAESQLAAGCGSGV